MPVGIVPRIALRGHWKLSDRQYAFCSRLLNLYRLRAGHEFDKHLCGWLFFNQRTRLHSAEFLAFLELFDICADRHGGRCGDRCVRRKTCLEIYNIICNRSDYSPHKIGDPDAAYTPESPIVHGKAAEMLRFWDLFRL